MKIARVLLIVSAVIFLTSCSAEKNMFKNAKRMNSIEGYENYLIKYEDGKYSEEAHQKISDIKFAQLRNTQFASFVDIYQSNAQADTSKILIKPNKSVLMGTPISIELLELPSNKSIKLHAYRRDRDRLLYSFGTYKSDEKGQVSLEKSESVMGTYTGKDGLGIFWSMSTPDIKELELPFNIRRLKQNTIFLAAECDGRIIASDELQLIDKLPGIVSEKISNDKMTAMFHYPKDKENLPVIILLGGSEGGYDNINQMAQVLSSNGYAVLALAYFKIKPLPDYLEKIPMEYFFHAVDWVKEQSNIDEESIIVAGGSRGGELALLLASLREDIKGVIAVEPSCVLWQGLPHNPFNIFFPQPAWTLDGKALPYLKHKLDLVTMAKFGSDATQIELMKLYEGVIENKSNVKKAFIKVENIHGPILLVAGKDGKLWPAYKMCQMIEERLENMDFKYPVESLYYEDAGHYVTVTPALLPTVGYKYEQIKVGGTDSGNAFAQMDSWQKVIEFLKSYFPI